MATLPFGRIVTAMVTPFDADGSLDLGRAGALARALTRPGRNDGLVVNGTTGESGATDAGEKTDLLRAVREAVGPDVPLTAGVGAAGTAQAVGLARDAERAGADALLVVAPYYCRPDQRGILRHVREVADSTDLPVMLYDIPSRTGVRIERETLLAAAEHERVVALKDATSDLPGATRGIAESGLAYYSGEDALNLPYLAIGAVGVVSVVGHLVADRLRQMADAVADGATTRAQQLNHAVEPLVRGLFRAPAAASTKHALALLGESCGDTRAPLVGLDDDAARLLAADLATVGPAPL